MSFYDTRNFQITDRTWAFLVRQDNH